MLTLGLAVLLPAAALILVNFNQLRVFERDRVVEAAIHRDFQEMLAITEKKIDKKAYTMTEEVRDLFPSPDAETQEKEKKLDLILSQTPWLAHVFLYDERGFLLRSQPQMMSDKYFHEEHDRMAESYRWLGTEAKSLVVGLHKKTRPIGFYSSPTKRAGEDAYLATAYFVLPQTSSDRVVLGGVTFDPCYLKQTFFPGMLKEAVNQKLSEQGGYPIAMMIYPAEYEGRGEMKPVATSTGSSSPTSMSAMRPKPIDSPGSKPPWRKYCGSTSLICRKPLRPTPKSTNAAWMLGSRLTIRPL